MPGSRWSLLPAALTTLLTVLFVVLWQALGQQSSALRRLRERVEAIEQREQVNNRQLLEEQMGTLRQRQQALDTQFSDLLQALEKEQAAARERERQQAKRQAELDRQPFLLPPQPPAGSGPPSQD
jgi:biopolymer transport protein ExbB/TolQ